MPSAIPLIGASQYSRCWVLDRQPKPRRDNCGVDALLTAVLPDYEGEPIAVSVACAESDTTSSAMS
jgi:hypothetical protein